MYKIIFLTFCFLLSIFNLLYAGENPTVELFSPEGTVKGVRQVSARFSAQIAPFGEPRLIEPFDISCPVTGNGRWADGKNWIYDFDKDLPAGVKCEFSLKPDLKSISGALVSGRRNFYFSTGGPSIIKSRPYEGNRWIDEKQIFILTLDAEPLKESVISNVYCSIEGINERVGVRIIEGQDMKQILEAAGYRDVVPIVQKNTGLIVLEEPGQEKPLIPRIVLQCRQSFPNNSEVRLIWGKGVKSLSGVATENDQVLPFKTRDYFNTTFRCSRENPNAGCIPMLPMRLVFTAPVSWQYAGKVILKGGGRNYKPSAAFEEDDEGANQNKKPEFVNALEFKGPFPQNTGFLIEIPKDLKDDDGRSLINAGNFPLAVRTDAYPPLAKFSARFGIIELKDNALLPVTLRNLEPHVKTRMIKIEEHRDTAGQKIKESILEKTVGIGEAVTSILPESMKNKGKDMVEGLKGRLHKVNMDREIKIIEWLKNIEKAGRRSSILKGAADVKDFSVPKPGGAKAFEVVGIPLKEPGFYVVEMESDILGASLLGQHSPMYVPTAALVTNLSVHLKHGRESSLVWVTTLDKAEPVKNADISIRDCNGKQVWSGNTNAEGVAYIRQQLPDNLPVCEQKHEADNHYDYSQLTALNGIYSGLFVFAKTKNDMAFVHSSWQDGIETWRFALPGASYNGSVIAHTIFDRTLLRAGETAHMKHIIRKHTMAGFAVINEPELPKAILIQHQGSEQAYEFPLKWDKNGIAETVWNIPKDAKLGYYETTLLKKASKKKQKTNIGRHEEGDEEFYAADGWTSGFFRVEEFRVPLMKGIIQPPKEPLVNTSGFDLDILVSYLSGGGASNAPVKLRTRLQPKYIRFGDYEDFTIANGKVEEGISKSAAAQFNDDDSEHLGRQNEKPKINSISLVLDKAGAARAAIPGIPTISTPQDVHTELEFKDPNGEIQTVTANIPLWPSKLLIGIKPDSWAASKDAFKFHVLALTLSGKPMPNVPVKVDILRRNHYSHRKRLIGGFYAYEHVTEVKRIGQICEGNTDAKGLLICETKSPVSGNVILQAVLKDEDGNISSANRDVWIAGKGAWWFDVSDNDRIDILPEKKRYEQGDKAKFQIRMPFKEATALVTVEREGVIDTYIKKIYGNNPVIEVPVKKNYAPNVFISVLCVRGRVSEVKPAAIVDLGRPAFKLGFAEIKVGWKANELKVNVSTEKKAYKIREKIRAKIKAVKADGSPPPKGSEVSIAVVDEGLLELMPNKSWNLLEAMMGRRGVEVSTATAQMQVVGKRHFGLKALPHGGGGGKQATRELFDTLLLWKGRVALDEKGEASVEVPLNDSLTSFRIAAVAHGGAGYFGTGHTGIRTTQDLMLLSGLPPMVREGDRFRAGFTVRNASDKSMDIEISASMNGAAFNSISENLGAGEAKEISWDAEIPHGAANLSWEVSAKDKNSDNFDRVKMRQSVIPAIPIRIFQATIKQIDKSFAIDVEKPKDAVQNRGGVNVSFRSRLSEGLGGVSYFMKNYPYTCLEQRVSRAIALRDKDLWSKVIADIPSHLDSQGLLKYFPSVSLGSDVLTSYVLSISDEAGWSIPEGIRERMEDGLKGFIEGRVIRHSSLPTADVSIRKMAAMEALSRYQKSSSSLLGSITVSPNLWPTSAVIDWINVLLRTQDIKERGEKLKEAEQIIRSRLNFQGSTMGFSTEKTDFLWWLMISGDVNAVRTILTFLNDEGWKADMPRLVNGAISRQYRGHWNTTNANAWGVLAMEKFSNKFESISVAGNTSVRIGDKQEGVNWDKSSKGGSLMLGWPKGKDTLNIRHSGTGGPWATIQSLAAIPLKEPFSSGYKIKKTMIPVEQKEKGRWSRGDVVRITLDLEAQADMTWVVVNDPVPAGSAILGTGLGRDSELLTKGEISKGWVWPAFEERALDSFRAYYEFVPKGKWTVEYTIRLNNSGLFHLPETRVEALYSPEMMGEIPNKRMEVGR